jgi:3-deoxy-manno-octulosonate cytidylyltransferase (CMP-KDO synthetase)
VQGDEPTLLPEAIEQVIHPLLADDEVVCASMISPLESEMDFRNPNIVKAACDQQGRILYFSRAPIPYFQKEGVTCPIYRESGIRAFRADFLQTYWHLPPTPFERAESVDMMRVLEHGYRIVGVPVNYPTLGVDHLTDVPLAEQALQNDPLQRQLYQQTLAL